MESDVIRDAFYRQNIKFMNDILILHRKKMAFSCEMCQRGRVPFLALTLALILNHYCRVHRHDPDFYVTCQVKQCCATYKKFEGYKSHLRRHHKGYDLRAIEENAENDQMDEDSSVHSADENENTDDNQLYDRPADQHDGLPEQNEENALFVLKTKEIYSLTQKATDSIISDTTYIVKNTINLLRMGVANRLDSAGIQFCAVPGLQELFEDDNPLSKPFHGLIGKTQQARYFKEHFGLVVS